jgi:hypothetical protein
MTPEQLQQILDAIPQQSSAPHWTTYVAVIAAFFGAYFAYLQLKKIAQQISDTREAIANDHKRSRRERTVEILKYYQEATKPEHNKMVKLLDLMPEDQLVRLRDAMVISLSGELKELACSALRTSFPSIYDDYCNENGPTTFTHGQSLQLRFIMLDVVNHYEVCLVPWKLGIVDKDEIESQFRALVDQRDGRFKLDKARRIIGSDKFPATEAFKAELFPTTDAEPPMPALATNS